MQMVLRKQIENQRPARAASDHQPATGMHRAIQYNTRQGTVGRSIFNLDTLLYNKLFEVFKLLGLAYLILRMGEVDLNTQITKSR